jgi:hypothetical protein
MRFANKDTSDGKKGDCCWPTKLGNRGRTSPNGAAKGARKRRRSQQRSRKGAAPRVTAGRITARAWQRTREIEAPRNEFRDRMRARIDFRDQSERGSIATTEIRGWGGSSPVGARLRSVRGRPALACETCSTRPRINAQRASRDVAFAANVLSSSRREVAQWAVCALRDFFRDHGMPRIDAPVIGMNRPVSRSRSTTRSPYFSANAAGARFVVIQSSRCSE